MSTSPYLAASQKAVVVHAAYRLGAHGFADFATIAPELEADSNLGLRDQVAALERLAGGLRKVTRPGPK